MADKRISQLVDRGTVANNDVVPIVVSGATTTNKATISSIQTFMQGNLDLGVTSVGITLGSSGTDVSVSGSPITSSGNITINLPTASATNRGVLSSADWTTFNNKVSSVGLSMPSAFSVANSPITGSGTIAVTGAGTVAQYIRGDGSLADFPSGGGGGGASVNYYLNGSVSQGSIGGIGYSQMSKTPILGAGTDFTIASTNYIASFITDAGNPALLEIPAGNWNFESYFSASSGGGSPSFYIELYKVNSGGTATLIASSSATPELISFGTSISPYFSPLAVPATVLTITDRLAVRYFVNNSGRTITLHTENSHLCQIITTFTTGLTALNGLTAQVQNFATGTSGTDFGISSASTTHTFNLPTASATNRGALSSTDWTTFNNKTSNVGTVTSVGLSSATSGVTIGSTPITTSGTITLAIATASGSQNGLLSSTDWTTFNNKQNALTNPVTGTGVAGQVALWNGTNSINSDAEFTYNSSTNLLTIGGGVTLTGAQTIQTSTGNLTLATAAGNGNIVLSAHGDGNVTTNDSIYIGSNSGINYGGFSNKLSVASTGYNFFDVSRFSNDNDGPRLYLGKSRGSTVGSNVIVQNGDLLGTISFEGDCGEGMVPAASISAEVDGVPGLTTDMPGRLIFRTCSDNTIFAAERLRIASTGAATFSTSAAVGGLNLSATYASKLGLYNPSGSANMELGNAINTNGSIVSRLVSTNVNNGNTGNESSANFIGVASIETQLVSTSGNASGTSGANMLFFTKADGGTLAERMRITSGGDVRINFNPGAGNGLYFHDSTANAAMLYFVPAIYVGSAPYNSNRIVSANNANLSFEAGGAERMKITSGGIIYALNNGVDGTYLPMIGGMYSSNNNETNLISTAVSSAANQSGFRFDVSNGAGSSARTTSMTINRSSVTIVGSLSKGSGSFKIDHPLTEKKDSHHLVHSFIEGPQADNIYRGKIDLVNGYVEVNIDEASGMSEGTFIVLNGNIQCFTSNEKGWTAIRGKVEGNILKIEAQDSKSTDTISWLVIGERIDQHMIDTDWTDENGKVIVEPLKEKEKEIEILNEDLPNENQIK